MQPSAPVGATASAKRKIQEPWPAKAESSEKSRSGSGSIRSLGGRGPVVWVVTLAERKLCFSAGSRREQNELPAKDIGGKETVLPEQNACSSVDNSVMRRVGSLKSQRKVAVS